MAHTPELIERIAAHVRETYPLHRGYKYEFEKGVEGLRGMCPDIQVRDAEGKLCCVVEIGYTRPEKLSAYRLVLGLSDVRWYDKNGNLHGDVREEIRVVHYDVRGKHRDPAIFMRVTVHNEIYCDTCFEDAARNIGLGFDYEDDGGADYGDLTEEIEREYRADHPWLEKCTKCKPRGEDSTEWDWEHLYEDHFEDISDMQAEAQEAVDSTIFFNGYRMIAVSFCDNCGVEWITEHAAEIQERMGIWTPDDFLELYSGQRAEIDRTRRQMLNAGADPAVDEFPQRTYTLEELEAYFERRDLPFSYGALQQAFD